MMPNMQDERIAWLAVRDELRKTSANAPGSGLMRWVRGINRNPDASEAADSVRNDIIDRQMTKYAIAADELVAEFSIEERFMLRAVGQVPEWYLGAIFDEAKRIKDVGTVEPLRERPRHYSRSMVTVDDVRRLAITLPRTSEHLIRDRVKFRVGSIVYVAFSRDETTMGFGYPKDERDALIASAPAKFFLPQPSDLRYQWVRCWLDRLDLEEMEELVCEAWRMCVPKFLARERLDSPTRPADRSS